MIIRLVGIALAICLPICKAYAQTSPPPDPASLSEIVITGERSPRTLSGTPSSVSVTNAEALQSQAAPDRIEQLLVLIPNVQIGSGAEGPAIRGQDTTGVLRDLPGFLGGTRPRTTLQVDGRDLGFNEFVFGVAPVWDLQQVEVFRSPQSTTQGRNSIAGAIFVHTNDPTYSWEGRVQAIGGDYATRQLSAVASGPLVADQLAIRVAADIRRSHTTSEITDRIEGADPNQDDYALLRVKLLAEPAALPGARLETTYVHLESQIPQIEGVRAPFEERRDPLPIYGAFLTNVDSLTAALDYKFAPALASTTTLSFGDSFITRFAPPGLGETRTGTRDLSGEMILRWEPQQPVQWLGGVHVLSQQLEQFINLSAVIGSGDFADRQASFGMFGEVNWRPMPRLKVVAGGRYQRDTQDRSGLLGSPSTGVAIDYHETFDAWLPRLSFSYDVTDHLAAGIQVQRAYNPGGTTMNFDTGEQDNFGAETLWSYESFARAALAGGRATLSANLFYYDMRDAQRAQFRPYTVPGGATAFWAEISNAPRAESYGLELELSGRTDRRLSLRAGIGLLGTRIIETSAPSDPILGKEFRRAPHLTASAAIDWRPVARLQLSAQLRHGSDYFSDDANSPALQIDGSTVLDARAAYTAGRMTIFTYVQNAFDEFYLTNLSSNIAGTAGPPRKIGLGLDVQF